MSRYYIAKMAVCQRFNFPALVEGDFDFPAKTPRLAPGQPVKKPPVRLIGVIVLSIELTLSRDSVCMGDDAYDHTQIVRIESMSDPIDEIMAIAKGYLAIIAGRGHSWDCYLNNTRIAAIEGNCVRIKQLSPDVTLESGDTLYFGYNSASY
jgi:hypothetical protein